MRLGLDGCEVPRPLSSHDDRKRPSSSSGSVRMRAGLPMADNKNKPRPRESELEFWARALGVSPRRLIALVAEVVDERLSPAISLVPAKVPVDQ